LLISGPLRVSSHIHLDLPSGLFSSRFTIKIWYTRNKTRIYKKGELKEEKKERKKKMRNTKRSKTRRFLKPQKVWGKVTELFKHAKVLLG
jgi:hypothetical protein